MELKELVNPEKHNQQSSFQFVDVITSTEDKAEVKAAQRRLIRSNATKYQWSLQTKSKLKRKLSSGHDSNKNSTFGLKYNQDQQLMTTATSTSLLGQDAALSAIWPSLPADDSSGLMKFNTDIIVPSLLPSIGTGVAHPAGASWTRLAISSPTLFKTWLRCAAIHRRLLQRQRLYSPDLVRLDAEVIAMLSRAMQDPCTAASDENILAVSGMAYYGCEIDDDGGGGGSDGVGQVGKLRVAMGPCQGPLTGLQGLHAYGLMRVVPEHLRGLESLVRLRGGVEKIQMEGLGALITYTDITEATRRLKRTNYPFISLVESTNCTEPAGIPTNELPDLGSAFPSAWQQSINNPLRALSQAIQDMANYTRIIYSHCEGIHLQNSLAALADHRNRTQHSLMSLPHHPLSLNSLFNGGDVYEPVRLATIIYSLLVIFPISAQTAPFAALATLLRRELSAQEASGWPETEIALFGWVLVMGGIAAIGTEERGWFVYKLAKLLKLLGFSDWTMLKYVLKRFLWLDATNDHDGMELWRDVANFRTLEEETLEKS